MVDPFQLPANKKSALPQWRFVKDVRVGRSPSPWRVHWKSAVLGGFWFLILVKCVLAHWAIVHWAMPFGSIWVVAPTVFAAVLCTIVFLAGNDDGAGE